MSKFNEKTIKKPCYNKAGGEAYKSSPKLRFLSILFTSFVEKQYYRDIDDTITELYAAIDDVKDYLFVAKAAIYARVVLGMRSITHLVAVKLARHFVEGWGNPKTWQSRTFTKLVHRVDDIMEILACYKKINGSLKPIPACLKRGLAKAFDQFDDYQIAKYQGKGNDISLIDAVNLLHPIPQECNEKSLELLVKDRLRCIDTWESKWSAIGQDKNEDLSDEEINFRKLSVIHKLIEDNRIGYFALLRNLRNILKLNPPGALINKICSILEDKAIIRKSLVMPFRFMRAYEAIVDSSECCSSLFLQPIIKSLNNAFEMICDEACRACRAICMHNFEYIKEEKVLIFLDASGSMAGSPLEIGSAFATILAKCFGSNYIYLFDTDISRFVFTGIDSYLTTMKAIQSKARDEHMHGTNFNLWLDELAAEESNKQVFDKIFVISDMQGWVESQSYKERYRKYAKKYPNCELFSIDVSGYGTLQMPEQNVYCLTGITDKVFDFIGFMNKAKHSLWKFPDIENIEI